MTKFVRLIGYDISVKKQGDNFLLKYVEFFDKNNKEHVEAMNNTLKHLETIKTNAPLKTAISSMKINQEDCTLSMEKEGTFEDIADQIVSEFIYFSHMGILSLSDLFEIISMREVGLK